MLHAAVVPVKSEQNASSMACVKQQRIHIRFQLPRMPDPVILLKSKGAHKMFVSDRIMYNMEYNEMKDHSKISKSSMKGVKVLKH